MTNDARDSRSASPPSAPGQPAFATGTASGGAGSSGASTRSAVSATRPPPLSPQARTALRNEFRQLLAEGAHGFCFSPYLEGQSPGSQVTGLQIRARLEVIRPFTRWVRTFSCTDGHEQTPAIAHSMGLKTLVGAWLGTDAAINEREIAGVIAVARAGHADIVAVGN
ncbi:MAG: hypothetical protein AB7U92_13330 [Piscinibacter sp.]|uniref:hypothetical protein n=1 Tax=Piscinibacter sp. TaxID=1903157 RepID=UPI003D0F145C